MNCDYFLVKNLIVENLDGKIMVFEWWRKPRFFPSEILDLVVGEKTDLLVKECMTKTITDQTPMCLFWHDQSGTAMERCSSSEPYDYKKSPMEFHFVNFQSLGTPPYFAIIKSNGISMKNVLSVTESYEWIRN